MTDNFRLKDPAKTAPQLFDVKGNIFQTGEGGMAILSQNTKDAKIQNNKFLGTGATGVMLNGDEASGTYAEGNLISGNNFSGSAYTDATVYLGPFTRHCKVVGVNRDKVVDEGIDNLIIGTKAHKHGVKSFYHPLKNFMPLKGKK
jgi:nitrous oxidase accessory protein NosD